MEQIAYANFETVDMAIGFYNGVVPEGYEPIYNESQMQEMILERNNAEKREFEILGRANALEAELKIAADMIERLKDDALTMALRLLGEDGDSFAPETREVMDRWRKECMAVLGA